MGENKVLSKYSNIINNINYVRKIFFWDEDDYENEIFSKLSSVRARTNVIRRYSTTSFGKNVVMTRTSYQVFEV